MSVNRIRQMNAVTEEGMHNPVVLLPGRVTFEIRDADRVPSLTSLMKRMQSGDKLLAARCRLSTCPVCCGSGMQLLLTATPRSSHWRSHMKAKPWIIGALIFVAAIVVSLAAFGATILWDIFQVLEHGL